MKKIKRIFTVLAAMVTVVSLAMPVQAAPKPYAYKVRVFAGNRGTVNGGSVVEQTGSGEVVFHQAQSGEGNGLGGTVTINGTEYVINVPDDGKYYAKGLRISGKDESENSYVKVNEDVDYVIAYGIMRDRVEYTVRYLDAGGNALVADRHYYGNAGDKPIVAFLNIDGYVPTNAYNLTKTLVKDGENVFTFTYTQRAAGGSDTTVTTEETVTTTNTITQVVPAEDAEGGAAGGGVTVVPGEGGDAQAEAGGEAAGEEAAGAEETPAEPQELIDLDDEEVPLANVPGAAGNAAGTEPGSFFVNMPPAVIVGVVSMAVLAVAAAWYLLFMKKKRTNTGNEEK